MGLMAGDPSPESVGEHLEEFVILLAGAAALPGGLAGDHLPDHLRLLPKSALSENGGFCNGRSPPRQQRPATHDL